MSKEWEIIKESNSLVAWVRTKNGEQQYIINKKMKDGKRVIPTAEKPISLPVILFDYMITQEVNEQLNVITKIQADIINSPYTTRILSLC